MNARSMDIDPGGNGRGAPRSLRRRIRRGSSTSIAMLGALCQDLVGDATAETVSHSPPQETEGIDDGPGTTRSAGFVPRCRGPRNLATHIDPDPTPDGDPDSEPDSNSRNSSNSNTRSDR
jgi:hypothetical protein